MKWTEQKKKRLLGKHDKRCEATRKTETRITERENVYQIQSQSRTRSGRSQQHGEGSTEKPFTKKAGC